MAVSLVARSVLTEDSLSVVVSDYCGGRVVESVIVATIVFGSHFAFSSRVEVATGDGGRAISEVWSVSVTGGSGVDKTHVATQECLPLLVIRSYKATSGRSPLFHVSTQTWAS